MKQILFTKEGYEKVLQEKADLEKTRPDAVADLKKAREMGDLSENGYYKSARAKLSSIDASLRHLTYVIRFGKVEEVSSYDSVTVGVTVSLSVDGEEVVYAIVGEHEANPSEKKISHLSPLGKALLDKKVGDSAVITTPNGQKTYKIIKIAS